MKRDNFRRKFASYDAFFTKYISFLRKINGPRQSDGLVCLAIFKTMNVLTNGVGYNEQI